MYLETRKGLRGTFSASNTEKLARMLAPSQPRTAAIAQETQRGLMDTTELRYQEDTLVNLVGMQSTWTNAVKVLVGGQRQIIFPKAAEAATAAAASSRMLSVLGEGSAREAVKAAEGSDVSAERLAHWKIEEESRRALLADQTRELVAADNPRATEWLRSDDDDATVRALLNKMQRQHQRPTVETLANAATMRISWRTSLKLHRVAWSTKRVPLGEMHALTIHRLQQAHRWRQAASLLLDGWRTGVELPLDAYVGTLRAVSQVVPAARRGRYAEHPAVWKTACKLLVTANEAHAAGDIDISGPIGAAMHDEVIRLATKLGRWELAMDVLLKMDVGHVPSHRVLVPHPSSFVQTLAACVAAGQEKMASVLLKAAAADNALERSSHTQLVELVRAAIRPSGALSPTFLHQLVDAVLSTIITNGPDTDSRSPSVALHGATEVLHAIGALLASMAVAPKADSDASTWERAAKAFALHESISRQHPSLRPTAAANDAVDLTAYRIGLERYLSFGRGLLKAPSHAASFAAYTATHYGNEPLFAVEAEVVAFRSAARSRLWQAALLHYGRVVTHPEAALVNASPAVLVSTLASAFRRSSGEAMSSVVAAAEAANVPAPWAQVFSVLSMAGRFRASADELVWAATLDAFRRAPRGEMVAQAHDVLGKLIADAKGEDADVLAADLQAEKARESIVVNATPLPGFERELL